ncbi:hypothetical protein N0V95_006102 [Ascochyta clinopodiicola]|nr:hypothetical protein N0V95_006102 [Ascochyta clinopodiicola]
MTDVETPAYMPEEAVAEDEQPPSAPDLATEEVAEGPAEEPAEGPAEESTKEPLAEDHAIGDILAEESLPKEDPAEEQIEEVLPIEFLHVEQLHADVPAAMEPSPDPEPALVVSTVQHSVEPEAPASEPNPEGDSDPVVDDVLDLYAELEPHVEANTQPDELPEIIQRSVEPDPDIEPDAAAETTPELDSKRLPEPPPNVIELEPIPELIANLEPEPLPQAEEQLEVVRRSAQPRGLAAEAEPAAPQLDSQPAPVSDLAREVPLPPISMKSAKPRKRDALRIRLAAGGKSKQRLLMFTAPKETKPLVAALQHEKAKGTDIKPLVDSMLATIAS